MSESKFGLSTIGQIAVPVNDVDRAIAFYQDVLGMKFLFKAPPGLGFFDCNGVRLLVEETPEDSIVKYSNIIYFKVDDIQEAYNQLEDRNLVFEQKPHLVAKMPDHDLWMAFFRDPDDNLLALMCEVRG
jgi:methylmalonyl-CoA/ethylmalonyl-CoA epimerase